MFDTNDPDKFAELARLGSLMLNPKFTLSGDLPSNLDEFILSDFWPQEVDSSAIVTTEEGIIRRARAVIVSYGLQKGQKFLDIGCGKGHCVIEASKRDVIARGFDIKVDWDDKPENEMLTTDFDVIKQEGPYDVIALYDVIDHIVNHEDCISLLNDVREVCTPNTKVYVRCHPWTSRHGGHLYLSINKAFSHILLSDQELDKIDREPVRKIRRPLGTYSGIFKESGLAVSNINTITRSMEKLFTSDCMVGVFEQRLKGKSGADRDWQSHVLPVEFVDYVLTLK